jgi:heme/copper-type cytochrome/quinol oxidase subunit 3
MISVNIVMFGVVLALIGAALAVFAICYALEIPCPPKSPHPEIASSAALALGAITLLFAVAVLQAPNAMSAPANARLRWFEALGVILGASFLIGVLVISARRRREASDFDANGEHFKVRH